MKKGTMTELEYAQAKVVLGTAALVSIMAEIEVRKAAGLNYVEHAAKIGSLIGSVSETSRQLTEALSNLKLE